MINLPGIFMINQKIMKHHMKSGLKPMFFLMVLLTLFSGMIFIHCQTSEEGRNLEEGFLNPPESARPRVWWHWMNGNITKEGIRADLEWMHRVGIGGFQNFDASLSTPQIVEKRLVYMTPEWKDAFLFTTRLADSLGLEMAIAGSPGWSESGGPWVKPSQAMKKYVWSETRLEGGKTFSGSLPQPSPATGPFQNFGSRNGLAGDGKTMVPEFYADACVFAYKLPEKDTDLVSLQPVITSSGGKFDLASLTDGDPATSSLLPPAKTGEKAWIQFGFDKPETMHALTIASYGTGGTANINSLPDYRTLESSPDGKIFQQILIIPNGGVGQRTLTFTPATAKYFRLNWKTPPPAPNNTWSQSVGIKPPNQPIPYGGTQVGEIILHKTAVINRFEEKAAFATFPEMHNFPTPETDAAWVIKKSDVVDLTDRMKEDGSFEWTPPAGKWVVVRLGYSLTGHKNGPASPEATGLEVDKLSPVHVKAYFTDYLDQYKDATGGLMGKKGLQYVITDSWEAGVQNWTDSMITEFSSRRGYEMLPWLPVLTGKVVENAGSSERFLWDFRKTIADLTAENHYDLLTTILKERGMGRYTESHESGRAFIGDGMEVKRTADIPMSATWTPQDGNSNAEIDTRYKADVRESASVAHIYGKKLVAAESMTAYRTAWAWSPELLKPTADMEMANGLNRFVIHTSVHQPVNDKIPGLGLGPYGQWFTRHETWAEQARSWTDYLSRSCFMLQQGKFVADVVWFYGEDNNITFLFKKKLPDVPEGYNYDFINADALINQLSVKDGLLTTPGGMRYRVLALDSNSVRMSLPVLRKIRELVQNGAVIWGPQPTVDPSLTGNPEEFSKIVNQLWAAGKEVNPAGRGKIHTGESLAAVLNQLGIKPDFTYSKPSEDTRLLFVHHKLGNIDFYWVNQRNDRSEELEASFRVGGKAPEIWHPETGAIEKASYSMKNGVTTVPLHLDPNDAVFVVFRHKTAKLSETETPVKEETLATVSGEWNLSFQKDRGAPESLQIHELKSWSENADEGVKYFSGTGSYSITLDAPAGWFAENTRLWLDLGDVKNLAEVIVNGKSLGIVWKKPFRTDITHALTKGSNTLEIKVTNLWVNRLIGDMQPGITKKYTYTTIPFYQADSPLKPSGLMGPVQIKAFR